MSDWPVGLSTGCFSHNSIFDCLETISRGGFNIIEICSFPLHLNYHDIDTVAHAARRVEELGMEAYSFHAPFADHIDISSGDASLREQALTEIFQAAEAAALFQVRYFVIHPGPEQWDLKEQKQRLDRVKWAAETLNRVADRCQQLGPDPLSHQPAVGESYVITLVRKPGAGDRHARFDERDLETGHFGVTAPDLDSTAQRAGGRLCRLRVSLRAACQSSTQGPRFFLAPNHNPKRSQSGISRAKPLAS